MGELDDLELGWLSGMIDGEGCFMAQYKGTGCPSMQFVIASRYDDLIVEKIFKRAIGHGSLRLVDPKKASTQCHFVVAGVKNALKVIPFMDRCRFFTKKRYEYKIWREIAILASPHLGSHRIPQEVGARFVDLVSELKAYKHAAKKEHLFGEERNKINDFMNTPL